MVIISKDNSLIAKQNRWMVILFLSPAILLYGYFFIYPSIKAFYISLFDWNGFTSTMNYIGLKNFYELFGDSHFWKIVIFGIL